MKKMFINLIILSFSLLPSDQCQFAYGIIDRFVDDLAIILIENKCLQLEMNINRLPHTSEEGSMIVIKMIDNEIIVVKELNEKTKTTRSKSENLIKKLRQK